MKRSGSAQSVPKIRIIGYLDDGSQAHLYARPVELDDTEVPSRFTASTVAREIRGNSLGSHLNHGFVLYDDLRKPASPELVGRLCVVALTDGRILVKQLQLGEVEGRFDLISSFGPAIRNVTIVWAAIVKTIIPPRQIVKQTPGSRHRQPGCRPSGHGSS